MAFIKVLSVLNSSCFSLFVPCRDNVGELINNTAILEHNTSSKSTCATFRNMVCTALDFSAQIELSFSVVNKFVVLA